MCIAASSLEVPCITPCCSIRQLRKGVCSFDSSGVEAPYPTQAQMMAPFPHTTHKKKRTAFMSVRAEIVGWRVKSAASEMAMAVRFKLRPQSACALSVCVYVCVYVRVCVLVFVWLVCMCGVVIVCWLTFFLTVLMLRAQSTTLERLTHVYGCT